MLKSRVRVTSCFLWAVLTLLGFYSPNPVKAESVLTNSATDFYFELESGVTFTVRSTAQTYGIDSMLWLYDSDNQLLAENDDYFGLDSYISYNVQTTGIYRLRTGVCCGDPNRWYGSSYTIDANVSPTNAPTTTTTTTTTIPIYLNPPQNLQVISVSEDTVYLNWDAPQPSNASVERYAVFFSCDNWETGYAIASTQTNASVGNLESGKSCQFKVRSDNDTIGVYSQFSDEVIGTTVSTTTTSTTSTTTTTEAPQPPPTTTLVSTTTLPPLVVTTSSSSTSTVPVTTTVVPSTTVIQTTTTTILPLPSTTLPEISSTTTIPVIGESLTPQEAIAIVTSAEVLQQLTSSEATEVFDSLEVSELSNEQANALVEAVQDAPEEVRAAFEEEVNVFDNKFNSYVPLGSKINVGQRKVLVAVSGVLFMSPVVSVSSSTSGTQSDSRKRR